LVTGDGFQASRKCVLKWDRSAESLRHSEPLAELCSAWTDPSTALRAALSVRPHTGNFFGQHPTRQHPIGDAFVESHFRKCGEKWGTRRLINSTRKADSSGLGPFGMTALWSGIAAVGWVRCPGIQAKAGLSTSLEMTEFLLGSGDGFRASCKCVLKGYRQR
jgi:hypothetical protein